MTVHSRGKRWAFIPTILAAAPIVEALFSAASFAYGVVNGQQLLDELKKINENLAKLDQKIDDLVLDINALKTGQQWLENVILYGDDVQRLTFCCMFWGLHYPCRQMAV